MDDFSKKRSILSKIKAEAERWIDPSTIGQAVIDYHMGEIERFQAQISSDAFVRDHEGYVLALGHLQAHQQALSTIESARDRLDGASAELKQLAEDEKQAA